MIQYQANSGVAIDGAVYCVGVNILPPLSSFRASHFLFTGKNIGFRYEIVHWPGYIVAAGIKRYTEHVNKKENVRSDRERAFINDRCLLILKAVSSFRLIVITFSLRDCSTRMLHKWEKSSVIPARGFHLKLYLAWTGFVSLRLLR